MKIEKLPSGSYRIRKMYKGETYTVMFDRKPTQKEAMLAMAKELENVQEKHTSMTFQTAAEEYLEAKEKEWKKFRAEVTDWEVEEYLYKF